MRLSQWVLFDDDEIAMAGASLKIIANSGQLVNLVREANFAKLFALYEQEDLLATARQYISETFLLIAKNMGLRNIFFKRQHLHPLMK